MNRCPNSVVNMVWNALRGMVFWLVASSTVAGVPPLLLAETYHQQVKVADYLVSEKLDGVRAYWDGRQFWTRKGNAIVAPAWFVEKLPARPLDGELWMGRGQFDVVSAALRRSVPDELEWQRIRYMMFELPDGEGDFAARAVALKRLAAEIGSGHVQAVEQFRLEDHAALMRRLKMVLREGGEGLMLHRTDAPYVTGRSDVLLKVKAWYDAEATVIGHLPGKGRNQGKLGALRVKTPDGVEFSLGTGLTDADRMNPPAVGRVVTYRYRELTPNGVPRFARYWRLRDDP